MTDSLVGPDRWPTLWRWKDNRKLREETMALHVVLALRFAWSCSDIEGRSHCSPLSSWVVRVWVTLTVNKAA